MNVFKFIGLLLLIAQLNLSEASANGAPIRSSSCIPIATNTYMPMLDSLRVPGLNTEFGKFEPWPLTPDQARIGYVAKRSSDNAFLIIPNRLEANMLVWTKLSRRSHPKSHCASRVVATFQSDADAQNLEPLYQAIRSAEPNAKFVRPIFQDVRVEFTIPFVGVVNRFDPRPTFSLGGVLIVWDLDARNTKILEEFITRTGPQTNLPGIILAKEMFTGLFISVAITINGQTLLGNQVNLLVDGK